MAAAVQQSRDSAAAKLGDSVRQLRRYLIQPTIHERILLQKVEKVELEREDLMSKHHLYASKAGVALTDNDMKTYIESKIDDAVDAIDEATVMMEKLKENKEKAAEEENRTSSEAKKVLE